MPENVMLNHNYVMAEGGTGVRALLAAHMYLSAKAYAAGENGRTENGNLFMRRWTPEQKRLSSCRNL